MFKVSGGEDAQVSLMNVNHRVWSHLVCSIFFRKFVMSVLGLSIKLELCTHWSPYEFNSSFLTSIPGLFSWESPSPLLWVKGMRTAVIICHRMLVFFCEILRIAIKSYACTTCSWSVDFDFPKSFQGTLANDIQKPQNAKSMAIFIPTL